MPASSPSCMFHQLDLVAAALGPARVHAQQHVGPVLALGAAGAGMDFEIGVVGVGLARRAASRSAGALASACSARIAASASSTIASSPSASPSSISVDRVVELALELADATPSRSSRSVRSRISFCAFVGVVPEVGILGAGVQLLEAARRRYPSQRCLLSSPDGLLDLVDERVDFSAHGAQ